MEGWTKITKRIEELKIRKFHPSLREATATETQLDTAQIL